MGLITQAQQDIPKDNNVTGIDPDTGQTIPGGGVAQKFDDPIETQPGFADPINTNIPEDGPTTLTDTDTTTPPPADTTNTASDRGVDTFSDLDPDPGASGSTGIPAPSAGRDSEFDSVSGQTDMINQGLIDLLSQNNPLFDIQAAKGKRAANARGLGSSSFSERAAQGAIYDVALPMVQQASQQAQQFEALYRAQDFEGRMAMETLARQQDFASRQAQLDRALQETMQGRDIEYRRWLQETTQEHEVLITRNQQAMDAYRTFQESAMQILANPESTPEQKEAGMAALREGLAGSLNLLQGLTNTDLSAYLPEGWRPTGGGVLPGGPTTGPGPGEPGGDPIILPGLPGGPGPGTGPRGINSPQMAVNTYLNDVIQQNRPPEYGDYTTWAQNNTPGMLLGPNEFQLLMQTAQV